MLWSPQHVVSDTGRLPPKVAHAWSVACVCVLVQVVLKSPELLAQLIELSGFGLSAVLTHGVDVMLPLFASYLPDLWQLSVDVLTAINKLVTSRTACATCSTAQRGSQGSSQNSLQQQQQRAHTHTGHGVGRVLMALFDALPSMWQCYQALLTQRCEQQHLLLEQCAEDTPLSQPLSQCEGTPQQGSGASTAVAAELYRKSAWLTQLLLVGCQLHAESGSVACACFMEAAADRRLKYAWRACLEDVVKSCRLALPKVGHTSME